MMAKLAVMNAEAPKASTARTKKHITMNMVPGGHLSRVLSAETFTDLVRGQPFGCHSCTWKGIFQQRHTSVVLYYSDPQQRVIYSQHRSQLVSQVFVKESMSTYTNTISCREHQTSKLKWLRSQLTLDNSITRHKLMLHCIAYLHDELMLSVLRCHGTY